MSVSRVPAGDEPVPKIGRERQPKAIAKSLYFQHINLPEIAKKTEIPLKTIQVWVFGRPGTAPEKTWKFQREEAERVVIDGIAQENEFYLRKIYEIGLPTIAKSLEKYRDYSMNLEECQAMVDIITKVDKLFRLAHAGNSNDPGNQNKPMTLIEIRNIIDGDFFNKVKEVKEANAAYLPPAGPEQPPADDGFEFDEQPPKPLPKPDVNKPKPTIGADCRILDQEPDGGSDDPVELAGTWADEGDDGPA